MDTKDKVIEHLLKRIAALEESPVPIFKATSRVIHTHISDRIEAIYFYDLIGVDIRGKTLNGEMYDITIKRRDEQ